MPTNRNDYYSVLSDAIEDIIEHGYDSAARIAYWSAKLKDAAERTLKPQTEMEAMLRETLASTYKRMVDNGGLVRMHPGVARWTIEKVRPALRAELDRRILASADLIRLNKKAAVEKTLHRFAGWSTSIPAGGTEASSKRAEAAKIRKPLAQVKFEERRVLIDQGHKLTSSLNSIVATDGGAIGGVWRSNWRQPNYNYREDHKERDGLFYAVDGSWAVEQGLIRKGEDYTKNITQPAEEPFCRCFYRYVYALRDVPPEYLTAKGKAALEEARAKIAAMA